MGLGKGGALLRDCGILSLRARCTSALLCDTSAAMSDRSTTLQPSAKTRTERPRLYKVLLLNDDFTPREFVVAVLASEFRMSEDEAVRVMLTAHQQGVCVVAVFPRDVAETKATRATEAGRANGFPLRFETEPET